MDPVTRVFQAAIGDDLVILACTVLDWSTRVPDGQTELQWLRCATAVGYLFSCVKTELFDIAYYITTLGQVSVIMCPDLFLTYGAVRMCFDWLTEILLLGLMS